MLSGDAQYSKTNLGPTILNNFTPTTRIHYPNEPLNVPHHVTFAYDPCGRYVVGVRLANAPDKTAWLCGANYEVLIRQYPPAEWLLLKRLDSDTPYVGFCVSEGKRRLVSVARAIMGESFAKATRCIDGDYLNLRFLNIDISI